jgi:hypothetical protein
LSKSNNSHSRLAVEIKAEFMYAVRGSTTLTILLLTLLILPGIATADGGSFELVMQADNRFLAPGDIFTMRLFIY